MILSNASPVLLIYVMLRYSKKKKVFVFKTVKPVINCKHIIVKTYFKPHIDALTNDDEFYFKMYQVLVTLYPLSVFLIACKIKEKKDMRPGCIALIPNL